MMIWRFTVAFSTVVALASYTAQASPETESVNACARALVNSLAVPGAEPPSYKLVYHESAGADAWADGRIGFHASASTFDLKATNPKTHAILARARCTTNRRGEVIAFTATSPSEKDATVTARR